MSTINTLNTINMDEQAIMDMNVYLPTVHKLLFIEKVTELEWLFRVEYKKGNVEAGQFMQVSLPGIGEAPISIANFDLEEGYLDFLIRKVGKVTDKIFELKAGDRIFLRGPYGHGFPIEQYKNKHIVMVVGGSGIAPVRPIIEYFTKHPDEMKSFKIIVGYKNYESVIFEEEFSRWRENIEILVTLDNVETARNIGKTEDEIHEGMVTKYIPDLKIPENMDEVEYIVVGPPVMMHFSCLEILKTGIPTEKIWVSFERKMSCAVGKCGHCKIDETYICLEGPVFRYDFAKKLLD